MKKIFRTSILFIVLASLISCFITTTDSVNEKEISSGKVIFGLQSVNAERPNILYNSTTEEFPSKVVLEYQLVGSTEKIEVNIDLMIFGGRYITEDVLVMDVGNYKITRFDVLNDSGVTIYSTPMIESKIAQNLDIFTPLEHNFIVFDGQINTLNMQVVKVTNESDPTDFGFDYFTFEAANYNKFYIKVLALNEENCWEYTTGNLKLQDKNTGIIEEIALLNKVNKIFIEKYANNGYESQQIGPQSLTISKEGYSPQKFNLSQFDLEKYEIDPLVVKLKKSPTKSNLVMMIATGKDVSQLDVSGITDMSYLMDSVASYLGYEKGYECDVVKDFNQDISSWDVSNVTNMSQMFKFAYSFNQDINRWDVSNVKDMSGMFNYASSFDQNIGSWDVSNVKNMNSMFCFATKFNTDISGWEVKNVTDMLGMFAYASAFNQKMDNWDVSSVKTMAHMFAHTTSFNQDISNWKNKLGNVENMSHMFWDTKAFDQDISSWDVSSVTNFSYFDSKASPSWTANEKPIFGNKKVNREKLVMLIATGKDVSQLDVSGITDMSYLMDSVASYLGYEKGYECDVVKDFNQDISSWDVSNVTNMSQMFKFAYSFNQDINRWDVSNVKDMSGMFNYASSFDQNIGSWDVSNVKNMNSMFCFATKFNTDISGWEVKNVTDMLGMFAYASAFNQKMDNWDVSSVKTMAHMFAHTTSFNQDIRNWKNKLGNVENMSHMFWDTKAFDQDISSWDVSSVTNFSYFDSKASPSWTANEKPNFGNKKVNREKLVMLIATGKDVSQLDVSGITDMSYLMDSVASYLGYSKSYQCFTVRHFNQDISSWDVGNVTNMSHMFLSASAFNQDISRWDVSNVNNMSHMFCYASSFNQCLNQWNVDKVSKYDNFCHEDNPVWLFTKRPNFPIDIYELARLISIEADVTKANVVQITDMSELFYVVAEIAGYGVAEASRCPAVINFNQNIGGWNVSNVTNMRAMFIWAKNFNQDISRWDVNNVTDMSGMFEEACSFDQDLSGWDVSSVVNNKGFDNFTSSAWTSVEKPIFGN